MVASGAAAGAGAASGSATGAGATRLGVGYALGAGASSGMPAFFLIFFTAADSHWATVSRHAEVPHLARCSSNLATSAAICSSGVSAISATGAAICVGCVERTER